MVSWPSHVVLNVSWAREMGSFGTENIAEDIRKESFLPE